MKATQKLILIVAAVLVLTVIGLGVGALLAVRNAALEFVQSFERSDIAAQFGDRELKCAVAQIELHKLRYGSYPRTLQDLRFLSPMDQTIVFNVAYYPNPELTAYYIEVRSGFFGKAKLEYPDEFWRGTGFRKELKPSAGSTGDLPKPDPPLPPPGRGAAGG